MSERVLEGYREELLALLQPLEADLLDLEKGQEPDGVGKVFRAVHNIKSAAALIGLQAAAGAAHALESLLEAMRDGTQPTNRTTITRLLGGVDALRALVRGEDGPAVQAALAALAHAPAEAWPASAPPSRRLRIALALQEDALERALDPLVLLSAVGELGTVERARLELSRLPDLEALVPERLYLAFELVLATSASAQELRSVFLFAEGSGTLEVEELAPAPGPGEAQEEGPAGGAISTLVVPARRVDALVDLSAELLIASTQVEHLRQEGVSSWDGRMESACREALRLASRIQEAAMAIRLVPLEPTFVMLRRFVRETSARLGKEVDVELKGGQTELDRSVAERLLDSLKHLVRNSLDHGIEAPAERRAAGKPPRGRLVLSAREEQRQVALTVEDDGRGIDPERVRATAISRGLIAPDAALPEAEALKLIFEPGFSTAREAGELSGRGVGLDVVRSNLMDLGGDLSVASRVGQGTCLALSVPLTLAVLEGLVVSAAGERLVVPLDVVEQLVHPGAGQIARLPDGRFVLRMPTGVVPILRPPGIEGPEAPRGGGVALIVSTHQGGRAALHVDEVLAQESVLLKPLHRGLRMGEGVLGAAIVGDGRVALVLDVAQLTARAAGDGAAQPVLLGGRVPVALSTKEVS